MLSRLSRACPGDFSMICNTFFNKKMLSTQRDGMGWGGRWAGGLGWGTHVNTCESMADSCQCMAKTTTIL